jgi:hypothetical protein
MTRATPPLVEGDACFYLRKSRREVGRGVYTAAYNIVCSFE